MHDSDNNAAVATATAPVTAPLADSPFNRQMALGHYMRTGHELRAHLADPVGGIWQLVRECC